jgi:DNA-binding transcriptional ArsR family regulator
MARPAAREDVFRAIADPTRRALLDQLRRGRKPVGVLADAFSLTLPAVSQHLRVLREVDLVREERDGRRRIYQLNPEPLREVADWLAHYERFWQRKLDALERYLDRTEKKR